MGARERAIKSICACVYVCVACTFCSSFPFLDSQGDGEIEKRSNRRGAEEERGGYR